MASYKYKAFISYAHADQKWAAWLHRTLETFVPPKLLGKAPGKSRGALKPIFRDQTEFAADHNLSAQIKTALEQSEYLIVVCSETAAQSHWVAEEIRLFKSIHGESKILCVIVDGTPQTAFPPALVLAKGAEPLAADPRSQGDGKRLCRLKIAAGLMGVGLDDLIQRDLKRKYRRVTAVTAASLMGMLAMGTITAIAISARHEATLRKADAEGLIEFMLTDLKEKLKPVGRLDVLGSVAERADQYYQSQDLSRMSDDSIGRRARAFHLMGEINDEEGDRVAAQAQFEKAANATFQLLTRSPNDTARIFDHSQSVFWTGYSKYTAGELDGAFSDFSQYESLASRLIELEPDNPDWLVERGYSLSNLGALHSARGDYDAAISAYEAGIKVDEQLIAMQPESESRLYTYASHVGWLTHVERKRGNLVQALKHADKETQIYDDIAELSGHPQTQNFRLMHDATNSALRKAFIFIETGQFQAALDLAQKTLIDTAKVVQRDPENIYYVRGHIRQLAQCEWGARIAGQTTKSKQFAQELDAFIKQLPISVTDAEIWQDELSPYVAIHRIRTLRPDIPASEHNVLVMRLITTLTAKRAEGKTAHPKAVKEMLAEAYLHKARHDFEMSQGKIGGRALAQAESLVEGDLTKSFVLNIAFYGAYSSGGQSDKANNIKNTLRAQGIKEADLIRLTEGA